LTNSILLEENTINFTWQGLPGGIILIVFGIVTIYWQFKRPAENKNNPIRGWIVGLGSLVIGGLFLYKSILWFMSR
jgi:hypothetical protein